MEENIHVDVAQLSRGVAKETLNILQPKLDSVNSDSSSKKVDRYACCLDSDYCFVSCVCIIFAK